MRYLSILICLLLASCQSGIINKLECEEIRRGKLSNTFMRIDEITYEKDEIIKYNSTITIEKQNNRKWVFLHFNSKDSIINYKNDDTEFTSKLLAKKLVQIDDKEYELIKYRIDEIGSQDEESNKFYCTEFGVIIETFWRRNYIKTTKFNGKINHKLNRLVEEILLDEAFLWSFN